jgi:hypothetical protein
MNELPIVCVKCKKLVYVRSAQHEPMTNTLIVNVSCRCMDSMLLIPVMDLQNGGSILINVEYTHET